MPEMAGSELALIIKRESPTQPIIMITAYTRQLESRENPVDAVLTKPFSFLDLRRIIAELLPESSDKPEVVG